MPRKSKKNRIDLADYKKIRDETLPLAARCAQFLNWLADTRPKLFVAPNELCRAVMGYDHMPQLKSDEVTKLRSRYGTIRAILRAKFDRDLLVEAGAGVRAAIDSGDMLVNGLPRYITKVASAKNALIQADSLIDMKQVPNTAEYAPYRKMHNQQVTPLLKQLMSKEFDDMLKLPAGDNDGKP